MALNTKMTGGFQFECIFGLAIKITICFISGISLYMYQQTFFLILWGNTQ